MGRLDELQEQYPDIVKVYRQPKHSRRALLRLHRRYNFRYTADEVIKYYRSGDLPSDIRESDAKLWDKHFDWYLCAGGNEENLRFLESFQALIYERTKTLEWRRERNEAFSTRARFSLV